MAEIILIVILTIITVNFIFDRVLESLNNKSISPRIPSGAEGIYDENKYRQMMEYHKANSRLDMLSSVFSFMITMSMFLFGGFAFLDNFVRSFTEHPVGMALLFFGIIAIASDLLSEPFSLYGVFVIEEKFGFNKTTFKTYLLDKVKSLLLSLVIGVPMLSLVIWLYMESGEYFWILVWVLTGLFMIIMAMFYTSLVVPLFNKLNPLADGELKNAIEDYSKNAGFALKNIFVIDGSKRSTKANAYFSGLGRKKKIVLYDTLIEKHTTQELVAVLAHEVGHYKKKHTRFSLVLSLAQSLVTLYIFSLVIDNPDLSAAMGAKATSFHLGAIVFGILYSPISFILGIFMNMLSRKNEFEADAFAKETYDGKSLQSALKKLSADSLSNLTPHPLYVFFHYSHPPLLERLKRLDS